MKNRIISFWENEQDTNNGFSIIHSYVRLSIRTRNTIYVECDFSKLIRKQNLYFLGNLINLLYMSFSKAVDKVHKIDSGL